MVFSETTLPRKHRRLALIAAFLGGFTTIGEAQSPVTPKQDSSGKTFQVLEGVKKRQLENGMTVLTLKDASIPNANMYLFWRVGSRNEYPGITGLAHFFEHMMFNGADKYGNGEFDKIMEAAGGSNNAYTSEDMTVYTDWFPKQALEVIFDLESDRIGNLKFDDQVIEKERQVVLSERRRGIENSNWQRLWVEVKGVGFLAHPYSWPVIGHESDIKNWTKQDLKTFFQTYYSPSNAVVVIVGDIDDHSVDELIEEYFEPLKRGPLPRKIHTIEPEQTGERRTFVSKKSVGSPKIMMAHHVPQANHEDTLALSFVSDLLGQGRTSRLYRRLVTDDKIATAVDVEMSESIDPNMIYVYANAMKGIKPSQLEASIVDEIEKLIKNGPTEAELQKIKNNYKVNLYRSLETINNKAQQLGRAEVLYGGYQAISKHFNQAMALTPEQLKSVAAKYLIRSNRTVGILDRAQSEGK